MIIDTQARPDVKRVAPIVMGRKDYLSELFRLVGMDLYKVYRRLLARVLLLVGICVIALVFLGIGIAVLHYASEPVTSFVPSKCAATPQLSAAGCITHQPATLADMQREKQRVVNGGAQFLTMPGAWFAEEHFFILPLAVLGVILAGTLVGGEYSLGTVRLMFTRGPTRLQFLIAKMLVLVIYVIPTILFLMLLGIVIGAVMAQLAGLANGLSFLTADHFGHVVLYALMAILYWYAYMLLALFFGTVGRSTVAAIVGPLIVLAIEPLVSSSITVLTSNSSGGLTDFLKHVPDYFLGNNLTSLLHNQGHILSFSDPGPYSNGHSLLVVAAYLVVFVGVSCWLTVHRDVTS
ncbi:MAG TPA: ABC transporter permease [Ktedonobacteraceae bacterium]|nr:ABC transporter permease [Ktedonobacteraceae bacterium]